MKSLNPALQAHLEEGTTTLACCWRITRADGVTCGFTDHDRTLSFDKTEFEPESGLTASDVRSGSDLSVDAQDAQGVLSSDRITETDTRSQMKRSSRLWRSTTDTNKTGARPALSLGARTCPTRFAIRSTQPTLRRRKGAPCSL
jgi:hypothetical protein